MNSIFKYCEILPNKILRLLSVEILLILATKKIYTSYSQTKVYILKWTTLYFRSSLWRRTQGHPGDCPSVPSQKKEGPQGKQNKKPVGCCIPRPFIYFLLESSYDWWLPYCMEWACSESSQSANKIFALVNMEIHKNDTANSVWFLKRFIRAVIPKA